MAKRTSFYECTSCGHHEPKWLGQCPSCGDWNTLIERSSRGAGSAQSSGTKSRRLSSVAAEHNSRITSGLGELDRALGGGLMPGSTVLVGGEPGIGKSTLMLQMAGGLRGMETLYVSGEESAAQIRQRADRLGLISDESSTLSLLCTADFNDLLSEIERMTPRVVVVDSVQTMIAADAGSVPGTVNQIKYLTHELTAWAHRSKSCVMLVAHVTKEGQIAGPKVVEHMVDAVLLFEHSGSDLRFLRATKNRFGAIEEIGIFTMEHRGLVELSDPGRVFLGGERGERPAGVVAAPCYEGSRVLVVEIQALTVPAKGSVSRSFSDRIDSRRVSRVAAVLEKHANLRFSDQDVYVNVAGGIRIQDVAIDLPLALALFSARTGQALPAGFLATGELSLAGEVRPISHQTQRERAAREMGFAALVGPAPGAGTSSFWRGVRTLPEAVRSAFQAQ